MDKVKTAELTERVTNNASLTAATVKRFLTDNAGALVSLAALTAKSLEGGSKILVFGNGGSAADAQHLAAEFVGRFLIERNPLPAISLTVNTSTITAVGNDYGFDQVFSRQLEAFAAKGDIAIGISTSGNSPNVIKAIEAANRLGCTTVGLTGEAGGGLAQICGNVFATPTAHTPRVQECHISWIHAYCDLVDEILFPPRGEEG